MFLIIEQGTTPPNVFFYKALVRKTSVKATVLKYNKTVHGPSEEDCQIKPNELLKMNRGLMHRYKDQLVVA